MENNRDSLNKILRNYNLTNNSFTETQSEYSTANQEDLTEYGNQFISKSGKVQKKKNEPLDYYCQLRRESYDLSINPHLKVFAFKFDELSNEFFKLNEYIITPYGI
jgi:hypothetical protein